MQVAHGGLQNSEVMLAYSRLMNLYDIITPPLTFHYFNSTFQVLLNIGEKNCTSFSKHHMYILDA